MATLCAVLFTGCSGSDPSDSVMELVKNGNIEQAQQIYAEKISGKEEYESSFAEKFIPYLENLIESYNNGELSEEKINDDFETYKEMLGENVTFKDVESQLSALEISKHCFETAEKLRLEGELTQAYRMYFSLHLSKSLPVKLQQMNSRGEQRQSKEHHRQEAIKSIYTSKERQSLQKYSFKNQK